MTDNTQPTPSPDIELHQARQELDAAQETIRRLQESQRSINYFLAVFFSESRTPLNSIIGFAEVILRGIDGPITEEQRRDLSRIKESGQQTLYLVNLTVDILRFEGRKADVADKLHLEEIDLKQILKDLVAQYEKQITIQVNVPGDLPNIWADWMVGKILTYTASALSENFSAGKLIIGVTFDDRWVTIKVANPDHRLSDYTLAEFTQSTAALTLSDCYGSLELCLGRAWAALFGGQMNLTGPAGEGTTVTFLLPIGRPPVTW
jgi:signal transduction histidine kinase